ncbi:hypothetical protein JK635_07995 [Neobacillus sp. YIM B02564]|uniref:Uncharacterized protein n=1 Tax=Neobacillus paridis TaxID=2803862 RepID=A0ABS1TLM6_9BACI|nr:hypothetical protein [Neobacillus paridis]MBL4952152.1 hypothetical protein [Neobacillus paridis]
MEFIHSLATVGVEEVYDEERFLAEQAFRKRLSLEHLSFEEDWNLRDELEKREFVS